jgi:hypothetical protein
VRPAGTDTGVGWDFSAPQANRHGWWRRDKQPVVGSVTNANTERKRKQRLLNLTKAMAAGRMKSCVPQQRREILPPDLHLSKPKSLRKLNVIN